MKNLSSSGKTSLIVLAACLWIPSFVAEAATIRVDCPSASLQAAIEKSRARDTLLVSGTCSENVVVHEEVVGITLDGQGKATINALDPGKHAVRITGRGITVRGFTVTGGGNGIRVERGGDALIDGNTVEKVGTFGIIVYTGFAVIINNTIQNNPQSGIAIAGASFAHIGFVTGGDKAAGPNFIQNNGAAGIVVSRSSSARIVGNIIRNNKRYGVEATRVSQVDVANNTIEGNGQDGIFVSRNSHVTVGSSLPGGKIFRIPNTTASNNSGVGIRCTRNSSADGRLGSLNGDKGAKAFDPSCVDDLES